MNNYQEEILNDLQNAKKSIKVAVSWLTDSVLLNALINARYRNIEVNVVLSSNEFNIIRYEKIQKLIQLGANVRKWGNEDPEVGQFMHYKFYIIDDEFAKSGSYNWSINAITNKEKLDKVDLSKSIKEFNECFNEGVYFFDGIENPEIIREELKSIEKKHKKILTPEMLITIRQTESALNEQRIEYQNKIREREIEIERIRKENLRKEEERKKAIAEQERLRKEKEEIEKKQKESERYETRDDVKKTVLPPTRYANN